MPDLFSAWPSVASALDLDYIDLQPGWRLRVLTPLLKSGGYRLRVTEEHATGNSTTLKVGDELQGYETAFYAVEPRDGGGVRIEFSAAEVTRESVTVPQASPREPLFQLPAGTKLVRLIYLKRLSAADHDMAVAAAAEMRDLNTMTREVQASENACRQGDRTFCSWIPAGIAVRPEVRILVGGLEQWDPAR